MNEAEVLQYGLQVIRVSKGIRNDDEYLVMETLKSLSDEDLARVHGTVTTQLSHDIEIKNLEPSVRKEVRLKRLRLTEMYRELQTFRYKWKLLEQQPEGYGKYSSQMILMGLTPMTYHQWCDVQVFFQVEIR